MSNLLNQRFSSLCSSHSTFKYGSLKTYLTGVVSSNSRVAPFTSPTNQRSLYTASYLGVDTFESQRTKVSGQFGHLKDNLIERMKSTIEGKNKMIFSEDLKNSIFLISSQPDDVTLLRQVISKYTEQATDIKFSTYQFGPVVMRLFYLFGDSDLAYEMLMDPKYNDFFNQERSYLICMDLCWDQGKYQQILDLYDRFSSIEGRDGKYPRDIVTLVAAACFKLNTPEAFKYCMNLFSGIRESKSRLTRRAISFFSYLALKQNDPEVALESLTLIDNAPYSAVLLSIRLMALAHLKRVDDILYIIRNIINRGRPLEKPIIMQDSMDAIDAAVESTGNAEYKNDWENVKRTLQENRLIQDNMLESVLCNPIDRSIRNDQQQQPYRQGFNTRTDSGQGGYSADQQRDNRFRGGPRSGGGYGGGYSNRYSGGYTGGYRRNDGYDSQRRNDDYGSQRRNDGYGNQRRSDDYGNQRRRNPDSQFREEGDESGY